MFKATIVPILSAAMMWAVSTVPGVAETQTLRVEVDESQILQLPTTPGAVIVGNPTIADVSIQGQQLFVHGRTYGQTNLIIMDLQGKQIANFNLIGVRTQDPLVSVYRGPTRTSYSCAGSCEAALQVGDDDQQFKKVSEQITKKIELATGSETAEAKAPEAPQ